MRKLKEKITRIKKSAIEVAVSSTAHGIPNIFRTDLKILQIMWFICICLSSAACVFLCVKSILKYYEYEVVTKISQIMEYPTSFPAISICNANGLTSEAAYNFFEEIKAKENLSKADLENNFYNDIILTKAMSERYNLSEAKLKSFGLPFETSLDYCLFNGKVKCNSSDFSWFFR